MALVVKSNSQAKGQNKFLLLKSLSGKNNWQVAKI